MQQYAIGCVYDRRFGNYESGYKVSLWPYSRCLKVSKVDHGPTRLVAYFALHTSPRVNFFEAKSNIFDLYNPPLSACLWVQN